MKKVIRQTLAVLLLLVALLALATGCGGKDQAESNGGAKGTQGVTGVSDVLASGVADANGTSSTTHVPSEEERSKALAAASTSAKGVDLDLTQLSGVMIYSQVFDMVSNPANYKGKIIRIEGNYGEYKDEETGTLYRACVIPDATACCQQGIEFVLKDDSNADEDLVEGLPVSVQGSFDTYYEGKIQYCTLRNAELV